MRRLNDYGGCVGALDEEERDGMFANDGRLMSHGK